MKSGLICHLGTIEDFHALYLDTVESPLSKPTERSWVGKKLDFHSTALGKAFLAWKTDGELRLYLDQLELAQYTPKTITDRNLQTRQQAFWRLFFCLFAAFSGTFTRTASDWKSLRHSLRRVLSIQ